MDYLCKTRIKIKRLKGTKSIVEVNLAIQLVDRHPLKQLTTNHPNRT